MPNALFVKNGWGLTSAFQQVTLPAGGVNVVSRNVGIAIQIPPGAAIRVSKLAWRVDLAPDVAVGTVVAPVRWRLMVVEAPVPSDIGLLQNQAFAPSGARLDIPQNVGNGASVPVWWDEWLDFSAGAPGLNVIAERVFPDGGPSADPSSFLTAMLFPLLDTTIAPAPLGAANAMMTLGLFGAGADAAAFGGSSGTSTTQPSLPRWDVPHQTRG